MYAYNVTIRVVVIAIAAITANSVGSRNHNF